ncbi:MAG: prepilin-type N-terminal cleavage/methylation domain-containing protein [Polyangia bacterium]
MKRSRRGFTLMEMMIALMLGAVIITPLYIITRGMSQETTKRQMETEAIQRARLGLEVLTRDLQRAGMMVSPNPEKDVESIVQDGQHAYYRRAVVHLNRGGSSSFDSLLISGNLVGAETYTGIVAPGGNPQQIEINELFDHEDDCFEEFGSGYAYAHMTTSTGQTLDAKLASAQCSGEGVGTQCRCTITVEPGELILDGPGGFASGQQIFLQANQTAFYRVETITRDTGSCTRMHHNLMRYFVDYDADSPNALGGQNCTQGNITGAMIDQGSAKLLAEYVENFQVWFRTVRPGDSVSIRPNYHRIGQMADLAGFAPPCNSIPVFQDAPGCANPGANDLACVVTDSEYGAEHVRSAMVRLAVRTERTDPQMEFAAENLDAGVVRFNVAEPPDPSSYCFEPGVFKVRTLNTEVAMPNLAAKVASFQDVPVSH